MEKNKKRRKLPYNLVSGILMVVLAIFSFYPIHLGAFLAISVAIISLEISGLRSAIEDYEKNIVVKIDPFGK